MTRILVVDDNEMIRTAMSRRLRNAGFEVVLAADGAEALNAARSETPHLILMDMAMPVKDGWTAARELSANADTAEIPIIGVTAQAVSEQHGHAMDVGCDDYVIKPFDFSDLLQKILRLLPPDAVASA